MKDGLHLCLADCEVQHGGRRILQHVCGVIVQPSHVGTPLAGKLPGVSTAVAVQVSGPPPPNFTPMSTNLPPAKPPTGPVDGGQGQGQPSLPPQLPPGQFR